MKPIIEIDWKEVFRAGHLMAAIVSWDTNHSIPWLIGHTLSGWFYLIYKLCGY